MGNTLVSRISSCGAEPTVENPHVDYVAACDLGTGPSCPIAVLVLEYRT
jgi:hypothetical protein